MASDMLLQIAGLVLIVAAVAIVFLLEAPVGKRLMYGAAYEELEFERSLMEARLPFIEAAATRDPSIVEKARWRASLPVDPPSFEWAALADRIGAADEEWAARPPLPPEEPTGWDLANVQLLAYWEALRTRRLGSGIRRAKRALRLAWVGGGVGCVLLLAGGLQLTTGLWSAPPSGRAAFVPDPPLGRPVYLAPLGNVQSAELQALADSTARMGPVRGPWGHQLEAARLRKMVTKYIGVMYYGLPESNDPRSVLYGNILGVSDLDTMGEDF